MGVLVRETRMGSVRAGVPGPLKSFWYCSNVAHFLSFPANRKLSLLSYMVRRWGRGMGAGWLLGLLSWIMLKNRFWLSTTPSTTKYYNLYFQVNETSTNSCAYWAD